MLLHILLSSCDLIHLQFAEKPGLYLSMIKSTKIFLPASDVWINSLPDYCGASSRRFVHGDFYEFYFCGLKLCYEEDGELALACKNNEHNTKWELVPMGNDQYIMKNSGMCITLFGEDAIEMQKCDHRNMKQRFIVLPYAKEKFLTPSLNDNIVERELEERIKLKANEEFFRAESLHI